MRSGRHRDLGPGSPVFPHVSRRLVLLGGALLVVLAALALLVWRKGQRQIACYSLGSIALILVAYYALYNLSWSSPTSSGSSPRSSLLRSSSLASCCSLLRSRSFQRSTRPGYTCRRGGRGAAAAPRTYAGVHDSDERRAPERGQLRPDQPPRRSGARRHSRGLNVKVGGVWDTMWVSYFLRNKRLFVESPSAFDHGDAPAPQAMWTLTRQDAVPADERAGAAFVPIDGTYALVHSPTP